MAPFYWFCFSEEPLLIQMQYWGWRQDAGVQCSVPLARRHAEIWKQVCKDGRKLRPGWRTPMGERLSPRGALTRGINPSPVHITQG